MRIVPVNGHVLIKQVDAQTVTKGGIVLPEHAQERPKQGVIQAVPLFGKSVDDIMLGTSFKKGQKVIYKAYAGNNIKVEGDEYILMPEEDILAIIEE